MNIKHKIVKKNGSALMLAIILTALFLITASVILNQINNQIRFNSRMYQEVQKKYKAEGNIENQISNIYKGTNEFLDSIKLKEENYFSTNKKQNYSENIEKNIDGIIVRATLNITVEKESGNKYKGIVTSKTIDLSNLENILLESIFEGYKVTMKLDFKTDDELNLTYNVKEYSKQILN